MSNVPKSRRDESPLEFYVQALRLRDTITTLMLHDFGAKKKVREGKEVVFNNISGDDRKTILEILEREGSNPVTVERFPSWFIERERDFFTNIMRDMVCNITYANSIFPRSLEEVEKRREYQTRAIGDCECILQELYFVHRVLAVNLNRMMPTVHDVEREIFLLKAWRKSDNRFRNLIRKAMKDDPTWTALRKILESMTKYVSEREKLPQSELESGGGVF